MARSSGTWQPGQRPKGAGKTPGYQHFAERLRYLVETHTVEEIKDVLKDSKKLDKRSVFDAMILMRIAEAITSDGRLSMESLLDRIIGKPAQPLDHRGTFTHQHEAVPATLGWLEELTGKDPLGKTPKPVLN